MAYIVRSIDEVMKYDIDNIEIDSFWNVRDEVEKKMHNIHAYPAKFPAFIASKAIAYAQGQGVDISCVADMFCGCGTVALEAKLHGIDFWGCDINPVATLIAKVKSNSYSTNILTKYYDSIIKTYNKLNITKEMYAQANPRLVYWFDEKNYNKLFKLKQSIELNVPNGKYKDAFWCMFSAILKSSSKWLTKSIKPQIDPCKTPVDVIKAFKQQYNKFIKAVDEISVNSDTYIKVLNKNFLSKRTKLPKVDLIISSPPYVTSYEYADLHQLSSLWLSYAEDYRELRKGSIGSVHNSDAYDFNLDKLNSVGKKILGELMGKKRATSKVKSIARYYTDMQNAISKCSDMLAFNGIAVFVVGDTEYKGVRIENSRHLVESLISSGFYEVKIAKRKISNKLLTPYRDEIGRFTTDKSNRKIYHEEFVIIGRRL